MEEIKTILENILHTKIINSIVIIILSIAIYKGITHFLNKSEERSKSKLFTSNKSKTYIKLTRSIFRYVFIIITLLILLQVNGIDVSSALAGVGILGAVIGLAIQDWLKDIIRGSSILSDNYFSVGDIVKYKEIEGKVLVIGIKTTKIQDLRTNNIISIANRNIEEIEVVSNFIFINIPMPYEVKVEKAERAINDIIEDIKENNNVEGCKYLGVNDLADSSIKYLIQVECNPIYKLQVRRDALRSVLTQLSRNRIEVPFNQIDVHTK